MNICIYGYMYMRIYVYMYMCIYVYKHIYIYTYMYAYTSPTSKPQFLQTPGILPSAAGERVGAPAFG